MGLLTFLQCANGDANISQIGRRFSVKIIVHQHCHFVRSDALGYRYVNANSVVQM